MLFFALSHCFLTFYVIKYMYHLKGDAFVKKILSFLLIFMLIISAVPLGAFTFTASAETDGYYTYTVTNGKATITDVNTSISGYVTIPSTLGGYPVTCIGSSAFSYCNSIKSVKIPNGVTTIEKYAFYGCNGLAGVSVPKSVTQIV